MNFSKNQKRIHTLTKEQAILKMQTDRAIEMKMLASSKFKNKLYHEASLDFEEVRNILLIFNIINIFIFIFFYLGN